MERYGMKVSMAKMKIMVTRKEIDQFIYVESLPAHRRILMYSICRSWDYMKRLVSSE